MNKNKRFKEKYGSWAVITGGTSGIGKELAHEVARQGLNILLVGRKEPVLALQMQELKGSRVEVSYCIADLSTSKGIDTVISNSIDLDVGLLVLAAGVESHGLFTDISLDKELGLLDLNVKSTLVLTHHFARRMVERKKGGILLVSSLTGHMPSPYFSNYAATKSYILNLGISLHAELSDKGIDVSVLSPGLTNTPMAEKIANDIDWSKTPMKAMEAQDVAKETIQQFGKKISIIPGRSNRFMVFFAKRVASYGMGKRMAMVMKKAIREEIL